MPLWGRNDASSNAVKFQVTGGSNAKGTTAYGNTTPGAFVAGQVTGVYGVDVAEATVADGKLAHPGWVLVTQGTGYVAKISVTAGGTGYAAGDVVLVSNGTVNAVATLTVAGGVVTGATLTNPGAGFINSAAIATATANSTGGASAGTGATFQVTLGGRAGRVNYETLVATGSITGDGSDDGRFPDA